MSQYGQQAQKMRDRHEDIEDLLGLGATVAEIIERSDYKGWRGIHTSLKQAGRGDLLDRLKLMLKDADLPAQWVSATPQGPTCTGELCPNRPYYKGLCLFHDGAQYRWCNEPDCPDAVVNGGKCGPHYDSDRRSR